MLQLFSHCRNYFHMGQLYIIFLSILRLQTFRESFSVEAQKYCSVEDAAAQLLISNCGQATLSIDSLTCH